ncbi:MAG: hypothetical protein LKJ83_06660 [Eubacteriaceae bacterium]|jgi:hypothetical protein|nr:hypothetical protein [Eubacteriaceae bacterium]
MKRKINRQITNLTAAERTVRFSFCSTSSAAGYLDPQGVSGSNNVLVRRQYHITSFLRSYMVFLMMMIARKAEIQAKWSGSSLSPMLFEKGNTI